jgi:hypothetical protein
MPDLQPPTIWLLLGHKAGDNSQVNALAEALGWPCERKHLVYRYTELLTNLLLGPTLAGVVRTQSSPLAPPWPDLVIAGGRRNEPVARWIQRQSEGRTRLVHIGRPWARPEYFDLIVTTPQYRLPDRPNILLNELPLQAASTQRLAAAAVWEPRLEHLPRPRIAVLVGGRSGQFPFAAGEGARLGQIADAMARQAGGSLLVTTSARTPPAATAALAATLTAPHYLYRWTPNAAGNPYWGYLALADAFIVTGDSLSMLADACATRRPVYLFELATGASRYRSLRVIAQRLFFALGPERLPRNIGRLHRRLIDSGRVVPLGQSFPPETPPPLDDLARAVARARALFA